ncbi:hypothetical protein MHYP_G00104810 [Metynnis hypsauchen]
MAPKKPPVTQAQPDTCEEEEGEPSSAQRPDRSAVEIANLRQTLQSFIDHQQRKDEELRNEATRQDQRWRSLQHQFGLLQEEVRRGQRGVQQDPEGQQTTTAAAARTRIYRPVAVAESTQETEGEHVRTAPVAWPRLPQLKDTDDIEHYFVMFERLALAARWPRADWAFQLVPLLEGKARAAFCKACLDKIWNGKEAKACPLCRKISKSTPLCSLSLKNTCESFKEAKKRKISPETQGMICFVHTEKHQLFCVDDQQLVCMQCVAQDHQDHSFCSISKVASEHKTQLHRTLQRHQTNLESQKSKKNAFDRISTEQLQSQVQQTEKQIKEEFEKLHEFLREEEKARIAALKEEEKQKMQIINERVKEAEKLCSGLSKRIKEIEDDMKSDDSVFLHKFKDIEERAKYTDPDLQLNVAPLIDEAKHLGNLKYKVWEKMKDICPYYPVILDPATKKLNMKLSAHLSSLTSERRLTPNSPDKNIKLVLGSEGFTSGTHTWDVEVGKNQQWAIGVIKESAKEKGSFSNSSVLIYQFKDKCSWNPVLLDFRKVRVILDFEKGQVMFTDPDTNTTLQTHPYIFTEKMYPCFCTYSQVPLKILPAKVSVSVSSV